MKTNKRHVHLSTVTFNEHPLQRTVNFDDILLNIPTLTTSTSRLTILPESKLPLVVNKSSVRCQLFIVFLSIFIALIIGFILIVLLITQLVSISTRTSLPDRYLSIYSKLPGNNKNAHLLTHLPLSWTDQYDFNHDLCHDFYYFICHKWISNHVLSPLEFKRSWLTERSHDIRQRFAQQLVELSEREMYRNQRKLNDTDTISTNIDATDQNLIRQTT
jgi:hypothetical protein